MKTVIMIPARSGSKRVKNKNLRLLSGKPLICYAIESAKQTGLDVYVNSNDDDILDLASSMGVNVYKRSEELASDTATNDEFMSDFMDNIEATHVLQVLPTSPFILKEEIQDFNEKMKKVETLVSVKDAQIGCVYKDTPINFSKEKRNPPSQEMEPVKIYTTSLMGWEVKKFKENVETLGCAYHGGNGTVEYHTLKGWSTIDIDNEEDFKLAETVAQYIPFEELYRDFYHEKNTHTDYYVPRILDDDGMEGGETEQCNESLVSVKNMLKEGPDDKSWFHTLVNTENNSCTLLNQLPGEGNRRHYHAKWNEWWYILRGTWLFEIEDEKHEVVEGDFILIQKGKKHKITNIGDTIATRLAVSRYDVEHIYDNEK